MHLHSLKFKSITRYTCNWFKRTRVVKKFTCFPMFWEWIGLCGKQQCDVTDVNSVSLFLFMMTTDLRSVTQKWIAQ